MNKAERKGKIFGWLLNRMSKDEADYIIEEMEQYAQQVSIEFAEHIKKLTPVNKITVHGPVGCPRNLTKEEIYNEWIKKQSKPQSNAKP